MDQVVMPDLVEVAVVTVAMGDMEVEVERIAEMQALAQEPEITEEQPERVAEVAGRCREEVAQALVERFSFDKEEI